MTPAWLLPAGHPDLCPGSHQPAPHCYPIPPNSHCSHCGQPHRPYPAPSIPGGGRLRPHHRTDRQQLTFEGVGRG